MKTRLIVFIICFSLASVMQAQEKDKSNSFLLSASAGISGEFKPALSLKVIYSHEYSYFFAIGVGTGVNYQNYRSQNEIDSYSLDLPVFVNIRGNFKSNSSSTVMPYYSLNFGLFFNLMKSDYECTVMKPTVGDYNGSYTEKILRYYEGLFLAPSVVKNALRSALLFAKAYSKLGFETLPDGKTPPYDIICSLKLDSADRLIDFCGAIQEISPIDSNVVPMPWAMPGYQDEVIMAAGTFVQGASIELSADSPIEEPFIAYIQGALTYEHAILAVEHTLVKTVK